MLGSSVGGGFDVNADGVDDVIVSAPLADSAPGTPENGGETYIISPVSPDEVVLLTLRPEGSDTWLEWSVPDRALAYNVYRGILSQLRLSGELRTSSMTQLACGIATDSNANQLPDTTDATIPPAGETWFYLVTGENQQGEGPLQPAGAVPPRLHDGQCP